MEGDAVGILRAGEREERRRILIREEKDGGNVIHQTGRGRKRSQRKHSQCRGRRRKERRKSVERRREEENMGDKDQPNILLRHA